MDAHALLNSPAVTSAGSVVATSITFWVKQWWEERKEDRVTQANKEVFDRLLNMVEKDLANRAEQDQHNLQIQRDNANSLRGLADGITALVHRDKQGG